MEQDTQFPRTGCIAQGNGALDQICADLRARTPDQIDRLAELTRESRKRLMRQGKVRALAIDRLCVLSLFDRHGLMILQLPPEGDGFNIGNMPVVRIPQSLKEDRDEV